MRVRREPEDEPIVVRRGSPSVLRTTGRGTPATLGHARRWTSDAAGRVRHAHQRARPAERSDLREEPGEHGGAPGRDGATGAAGPGARLALPLMLSRIARLA